MNSPESLSQDWALLLVPASIIYSPASTILEQPATEGIATVQSGNEEVLSSLGSPRLLSWFCGFTDAL